MITAERRFSPTKRQVEAYEESWNQDHASLKECWACENLIEVGLSVYHSLQQVFTAWEDRVFRGSEPYSNDANDLFRVLHQRWHQVSSEILNWGTALQAQYPTVTHIDQLRAVVETVGKKLEQWQPPKLYSAIGLREIALSPEAARELDRVIAEAKTNPPSMPAGPLPRPMSREEFLALRKQS